MPNHYWYTDSKEQTYKDRLHVQNVGMFSFVATIFGMHSMVAKCKPWSYNAI